MDEAFTKVSSWVADASVRIIGIYGMGGVGKTTKENIQNVQKQIGKRLGLAWSEDDDKNDKARHVFNVLRKKRFLLLLDDIWERLDLDAIGIPSPHMSDNISKVVFTTRSEGVCTEMEANKKFKVPLLYWDQAWTLFQKKLGEEALNYHPEIPKLAESVAKECGGLPLALIAIGRAMAIKKTPHEWNHALKTLQKYAAGFSDWNISCVQIISFWIGEGFLDECKDMDDAVNKGHDIIGSLKATCLLENSVYGETDVKMHDIVRDLALWIMRECGEKESKILVEAKVGLTRAPNVERWEDAERISLMENEIEELTGAPKCPHLLTLMLCGNRQLSVIPDEFFQYMPILRVLDLSKAEIKVVPKSIGGLLSLRFLSLYSTYIRTCPEELGNLVKLKYLNLGRTWVRTIPHGVISRFPRMRSLNLEGFKLNDSLAAELESLEYLRELGITITESQPLLSQRLISCITNLQIKECTGLTELALSSSLLKKTRRVNAVLYLISLPGLSKIIWTESATHLYFKHLSDVEIGDCNALKDISWLVLAPFLRKLDVINCSELADIILDRFASLELKRLPKLKSIVRGTLLFPRLDKITVTCCPMLKKLPLASTSTDKSKLGIHGSTKWWNELQWEDEIANSSFQPYFVQCKESE
ncbi:hypothetical protein ACHQM5_021175 [Ranunculus cassubicifolius]